MESWKEGKGLKVGEKPSLNKISQSPNPAKILYSLESELSVADLLLEQTRQTSILAPISHLLHSFAKADWLASGKTPLPCDLQDDH